MADSKTDAGGVDKLSERKLSCRELARYVWDRAQNSPAFFEQDIARLIENERKRAVERSTPVRCDGEPVAWRHKKRGTTYTEIGRANLQIATDPVGEDDRMVVYQSDTDGRLWVRGEAEFEDGRFERLAAPPARSDAGLNFKSNVDLSEATRSVRSLYDMARPRRDAESATAFFETKEEADEAADNGRNTGGKSYYRPSTSPPPPGVREALEIVQSAYYSEPTGPQETAWNDACQHIEDGIRALSTPAVKP